MLRSFAATAMHETNTPKRDCQEQTRPGLPKMSSGSNADTMKFGTSTYWLTLEVDRDAAERGGLLAGPAAACRQSLIDGTPVAASAPLDDCPDQFGNNDIYGGTYLDPTPR
jgi:hypothetical protein